MRILVTSDGIDTLERAADYTTFFAAPIGAEPDESMITLMGFCKGEEETEGELDELQTLRDRLADRLGGPIETSLRCGDPADRIVEETEQHDYDLVVLGIHLRRRLTHLRPKIVARHLAARLDIPLLIVFPEWDQLRRLLICTSAAREDMPVVRTAGWLASQADAEVTVLHVMSQIPLSVDAQVQDLERSAEELMEHEAREGIHFERVMEILGQVGMPPEKAEARIRHGLVVDEIVRESEEGDFDLIALGAHHVSSERSWHELRELIQEDIAERVLLGARRPVLIVSASTG
jgi:nucleotide-binding universal stress UspA family protein